MCVLPSAAEHQQQERKWFSKHRPRSETGRRFMPRCKRTLRAQNLPFICSPNCWFVFSIIVGWKIPMTGSTYSGAESYFFPKSCLHLLWSSTDSHWWQETAKYCSTETSKQEHLRVVEPVSLELQVKLPGPVPSHNPLQG